MKVAVFARLAFAAIISIYCVQHIDAAIASSTVQMSIDPKDAQLSALLSSPLPLFSSDANNKVTAYKKLLTTVTAQANDSFITKALDGYFKNVLTPSLLQTNLTVANIQDVQNTTDRIISTLATVSNQLAKVQGADAKRAVFLDAINVLKSSYADLVQKNDKQKSILNLLATSRALPNSNFQDKVSQYINVLQQIDLSVLDSIKQDFVNDLEKLVLYAKSKGKSELEAITKLLSLAQVYPAFNSQLKQQCAVMMQDKPQSVATSVALEAVVAAAKPDQAFANKLKEVSAKNTFLEKISGVRDLLALLTGATLQADKNSIIAVCNDLFMQQAVMKKNELMALKDLFDACQKNQFLLAQNQKDVMDQWSKALVTALQFSDETMPLLANIKSKMDPSSTSFDDAIKAVVYALNVLDTKLAPAELDKLNPTSLVMTIRQQLPVFFNNRSGKSIEEIKAIKNLFELASKRSNVVDGIGKGWIDTLNMNMDIATASLQTNTLSKLDALLEIARSMKASTDQYEKNIFIDMISTIFANRKERAQKEIDVFRTLLATMTSPEAVKSTVYQASDFKKFETWKSVLDVTASLLSIKQKPSIKDRIFALNKTIPIVSQSDNAYEKSLFTAAVKNIFDIRGDMGSKDIADIQTFFKAIKTTFELLSPTTIDPWITDLAYASTIITGNQTYLEAIIQKASDSNDLKLFSKALDLFTLNTKPDVKKSFVSGLNKLVTNHQTIDANALRDLLKAVGNKKIFGMPFLSQEQQIVLIQWLKVI